MKNYKHKILAVLAFSAVIVLAAGQISAETNIVNPKSLVSNSRPDVTKSNSPDFIAGWNAGVEEGIEKVNSCYISGNYSNTEEIRINANIRNKGKSSEYIAGFKAGLEEVVNRYNDLYCGW